MKEIECPKSLFLFISVVYIKTFDIGKCHFSILS